MSITNDSASNSEALKALRAIVGDEALEETLLILLRDYTVEAAANRYFDGERPTGVLPHSTVGPPREQPMKRPAEAPQPNASPEKSHRITSLPPARQKPPHHEALVGPKPPSSKPLAERMRPNKLDDLIGQGAALDAVLRQALDEERLPSLVLWGPPGCGKTSFAHCVAARVSASPNSVFRSMSAAKCGISDLREVLSKAANASRLGVRTILFVDELHRWSKSQQDALLDDVEKGSVTLVGATTENPSFSINNAVLSRCRVVVFSKVADDALSAVLDRALATDPVLHGAHLTSEGRRAIIAAADGDARAALNTLELAVASVGTCRGDWQESGPGSSSGDGAGDEAGNRIGAQRKGCEADGSEGDGSRSGGGGVGRAVDEAAVAAVVQRAVAYYDRSGEFHYDLISAFHKSMRGGDADGALYYCSRMLAAGEDPRYLTRRLIRFASEDVGLADPCALQQATAADQAVQAIGMPEAGVCVAQAAIYMALAPKSCAVYQAFNKALAAASDEARHAVPIHLRNAPTRLLKSLGYGKGYVYNPSQGYQRGCEEGYLPPELGSGRRFFDRADCEPGHTMRFCD